MSNEIFSDTDTPDWNKLMDSYEQYVDKYISFEKKLPRVIGKAQELEKEFGNANSKLSPEQLQRFTDIQSKIIKAGQSMN